MQWNKQAFIAKLPAWLPGSDFPGQLADAIEAGLASKSTELSAREAALVDILRTAGDGFVPFDELQRRVFPNAAPGSNPAAVYVRYIRRKLGAACIVTVRGRGYKWAGGEK